MEDKMKHAQEYCKNTVHVPMIDTENVEAMLYNMRLMAFSAGYEKAKEVLLAEVLEEFDRGLAESETPNAYEKGALVILQRVITKLKGE